ncbi:hypothetical protein ZHAS_00021389 [Anopheles sinensis]|uniref:Uncharacterized protein n=1 Tax=Anopheles sinensis TaxID=74873 RepID=A0A084WSA2_ANOSI|nr:hypothetical protein ZHAS_00021389 [Anopheles sinensis]
MPLALCKQSLIPRLLIPERIPLLSRVLRTVSTGGLTARHLTHGHCHWDTAFRHRTQLCTVSFLGAPSLTLRNLFCYDDGKIRHRAAVHDKWYVPEESTKRKGIGRRIGLISDATRQYTTATIALLHGPYGTRGKSRNCCCS